MTSEAYKKIELVNLRFSVWTHLLKHKSKIGGDFYVTFHENLAISLEKFYPESIFEFVLRIHVKTLNLVLFLKRF